MIRSELVFRIAALNPHLYEKDCEAVVDTILGRIEAALVAGDRVEIRGFGAFSAKHLLRLCHKAGNTLQNLGFSLTPALRKSEQYQ